MKIIPKEVIDAQNALRSNLNTKKNAFIELIEEVQKTSPEFTGSEEEINALSEGEVKVALIDARSACVDAASKIGAADSWFADVQRAMAMKKREAARKAREEAAKNN